MSPLIPDDVWRRAGVILRTNAVLHGMVTPGLRAVGVTWTETLVSGYFFYESVSEVERDNVAEAETEMYAATPDPNEHIEFSAIEVPVGESPEIRFAGGVWVYVRYEAGGYRWLPGNDGGEPLSSCGELRSSLDPGATNRCADARSTAEHRLGSSTGTDPLPRR